MFKTMIGSLFITTTLLTTSMGLGANMISNGDDFKYVNVELGSYGEVRRYIDDSLTIKEYCLVMEYDAEDIAELKERCGEEFETADSGYKRVPDFKIIGARDSYEDIVYAVIDL